MKNNDLYRNYCGKDRNMMKKDGRDERNRQDEEVRKQDGTKETEGMRKQDGTKEDEGVRKQDGTKEDEGVR